jgi:hypothetical protein
MKMGHLFPTFNPFYWIGLRTQGWPEFMFIDRAELLEGYAHWGTVPNGPNEPNNINGTEFCAGANFTEFFDGAWGWSDELCTLKAPFVCKIRRRQCCTFWLLLVQITASTQAPTKRADAGT